MLAALALVIAVVDAGVPKPATDLQIVESVEQPSNSDHGQKIVNVIREAIPQGTEYTIMYASAFEGNDDRPVLDWSKMLHLMLKAKQAGATHICTAFNGDAENSAIAAEFAQKIGITIVASMGNDPDRGEYKAWLGRQEGVVGVLATEYRHKKSPEFVSFVEYETSGIVDAETRGSSFASARICAELSLAASKNYLTASR